MIIRTLFVTTVLITSIAAPTTKIKEPKKAYIGNTLVLSGQYAIKDSYDYNKFFNTINRSQSIDLDINGQGTTGDIEIFCYRPNETSGVYQMDYLRIQYDEEDESFKIACYEEDRRGYIDTSWFYEEDVETIDNFNTTVISGMQTTTDFMKNLVINFNKEYYISDPNEIAIFELFISKEGNRYTNAYNGYYHLNNGNWYTNIYSYEYRGALIITNAIMYTGISYNSWNDNQVALISTTWNFEQGTTTYNNTNLYDNGTYSQTTNMSINGIIPYYVKQSMNAIGTFQYIDDTPPTTWYEMILSTMDAPIYYLKSLLGFELFGINLFLAFSSLLTLVVIIAVMKKVI